MNKFTHIKLQALEYLASYKSSQRNSRSFHNHGEGPYKGYMASCIFTLKNLLRHYDKQALPQVIGTPTQGHRGQLF